MFNGNERLRGNARYHAQAKAWTPAQAKAWTPVKIFTSLGFQI